MNNNKTNITVSTVYKHSQIKDEKRFARYHLRHLLVVNTTLRKPFIAYFHKYLIHVLLKIRLLNVKK